LRADVKEQLAMGNCRLRRTTASAGKGYLL
jgi:hypothetical protein